MNEEIMVSICCLVFNHEKYLRKCLDGFVMQKTNFKFEVLVHDDASTDGSADIIREYEEKYPDIIKPIYQNENQYSMGVRISREYQYSRVKGKYMSWCEGDDYWTDENKLQKQFDALESNPEIYMCVHKVKLWNDSISEFSNNTYPNESFNNNIISKRYIIENSHIYLFHTSSFFIRSDIFLNLYYKHIDLANSSPVGDRLIVSLMASVSDFYYFDEPMSVYRTMVKGSWNSAHNNDIEKKLNFIARKKEFFEKYNEYLMNNCTEKYDLSSAFDNLWYEENYHKHNYKEIVRLKNLRKTLSVVSLREWSLDLLKAFKIVKD